MSDERKKRLMDALGESSVGPRRKGREAPAEKIGEWQELPNGMFMREVVINEECIRMEFASYSKEQADEVARRLDEIPKELDEARRMLHEVSARIQAPAPDDPCRPEDIQLLIDTAKQVEVLFEQSIRSAEAARKFEEWEKKSRFGTARTRKNPKAAEQAAAKAQAKQLWAERRAGLHPGIRTNEQFAMEALKRWSALTSIKVVCDWATQWEKEARSKAKK